MEKRYNVLACCGAGNGSCQLVALKVRRVFQKLGVKANIEINTVSLGKATGHNFDLNFCNASLEKNFDNARAKGATVIGLKNIMSEAEIEEKLKAYLDARG